MSSLGRCVPAGGTRSGEGQAGTVRRGARGPGREPPSLASTSLSQPKGHRLCAPLTRPSPCLRAPKQPRPRRHPPHGARGRRSPWQPRRPHGNAEAGMQGVGPAQSISRPQPGAGGLRVSCPGPQGLPERVGCGEVTGSTLPHGWRCFPFRCGAQPWGGASTQDGSGPAPGPRPLKSSQGNAQQHKSKKQNAVRPQNPN